MRVSPISGFFKKNGADLYVQVIDIAGGATVRFQQFQTGTINGEPQFETRSDQDHWNSANFANKYSMINGQYFAIQPYYWIRYNTTLSFGVRSNWSVLTYGADNASIAKKILVVQNSPSGAHVHPYDPYWLNLSSIPTTIVGLDPSVDKSSTSLTGRTFMCTAGGSISPQPWLVTLVGSSLTQSQAVTEISKFNCASGSIIMMDGSGSSKFITSLGYRTSPSDSRTIPQVIVFTNM